MARAPRIRNPGAGNIPTGYILGRTDGRIGDVQLLAISQFQQIAGAGAIVSTGTTGTAVAALSIFAVGNTTSSATITGSLSFAGAGAVSIGVSGGSVVVSSPATIASASTMNLTATGNTTGSSSATTRLIIGETISFAGGVSGGYSGNTMIISGATTAASATTINVTALGNTTGSSSATTRLITAESISFTGGVSGGWSGNTLIISGAASQAASATSMNMTALGNTTGSSSATTKLLTEMSISGMGDISAGFSGGTIVISGTAPVASATSMGLTAAGNTTGTTSSMTQAITAETISFAGGVSGGFSGGTLIISGGIGTQVGGIGTISHFSNNPQMTATRSAFVSIATLHCCPVIPPSVVSFNHIGVLHSAILTNGAAMTISTSLAASFTATVSRLELNTWAIGIWTNQSNGVTYTLQGSTTVPQAISQSASISQTAGSITVSDWITIQYGGLGGVTTQDTLSATHSSVAANMLISIGSGLATANYNGPLYYIYPWVSSMNTGVNIVGVGLLSFSIGTTTGTSRISMGAVTMWPMGLFFGSQPIRPIIITGSNQGNAVPAYNMLTSSAGSVMPGSIVLSVSQSASSGAPFFNFNSW